ncbi:677_t:CDS:1 [Funneliformis geosporum]|uniref:677_t:CDS:1 n=1 Tax=Funneliformis geosporum TaxID=1117311 RepID=A0A9W4WZ41_9GLOM|nr:677_t:CDS:1 [Funneliformis geosporum]
MTRKNVSKQKNHPKFVSYIAPKAFKETTSPLPVPSIPINFDIEIVKEVVGLPQNKETEFEFFDVSKITTINKISPIILTSNNNNNNNMQVDNTTKGSKDQSKLLEPDKYFEDDTIEEDFTVAIANTVNY